MVSFGEPCVYACRYCYASAPPFKGYPRRAGQEIIKAVEGYAPDSFDNIYVSCDMESFVDQRRALDLLEGLMVFRKTIHFTTKVPLCDDIVGSIAQLDTVARTWGGMVIPAVSICATSSASRLEPPPVPSFEARFDLVRRLSAKGLRVVLAMRPFIPTVPLSEYDEILGSLAGHIDCVLGGVLFADLGGLIERRLGSRLGDCDERLMYFVEQPQRWKVYEGTRERAHVAARCREIGLEFYMTSPPAIESIKQRCLGE